MRKNQQQSSNTVPVNRKNLQPQLHLPKNPKITQLSVQKLKQPLPLQNPNTHPPTHPSTHPSTNININTYQNININNSKKSSSVTNLGSLLFNSSNSKIITHHKSITDNRVSAKKLVEFQRYSKSPKKIGVYYNTNMNNCSSSKGVNQDQENQEKNSNSNSNSNSSNNNNSTNGNINMDYQQKRTRVYGMPYFFENSTANKLEQQVKYIAVPRSPQYLHSPISAAYKKQYSETLSTTTSNNKNSTGTNLKISDFKLGPPLGVGKFGYVFMARHIASGFICAIKQIKKQGLDQILEGQLIRQIKIQMFLNHPNIVKLYTFFADKNHIYLVLQLCYSGQLYNFLKKHQPVSEELAKVIIRQICQGLYYIHQNHIIHRDLKPQNILYHNSMIKICDFGWSIATPLMRQTFCGTPLYISPELLKRTCYNNKVDIWSLGILSYEILIGQVPFEIFCEADYIKILKNQVKFPKLLTISQQAKDFIRVCLQKDPEKRLTSSQLIQHPFLKKVELVSFSEIN